MDETGERVAVREAPRMMPKFLSLQNKMILNIRVLVPLCQWAGSDFTVTQTFMRSAVSVTVPSE